MPATSTTTSKTYTALNMQQQVLKSIFKNKIVKEVLDYIKESCLSQANNIQRCLIDSNAINMFYRKMEISSKKTKKEKNMFDYNSIAQFKIALQLLGYYIEQWPDKVKYGKLNQIIIRW